MNREKPRLLQVIASTLAAAFGVQNDKNRERDFTHGNIKTFIIAGITFTAVFVILLIILVNQILKYSGI